MVRGTVRQVYEACPCTSVMQSIPYIVQLKVARGMLKLQKDALMCVIVIILCQECVVLVAIYL